MGVSIVIPAYQEGESLARTISDVYEKSQLLSFEVVVIVDSPFDLSVNIVVPLQNRYQNLQLLIQNRKGPLSAIDFGVRSSNQEFIVVLTADDTDDVGDILKIVRCLENGAHYVSASRYIENGRYSGGPQLKRLFSKTASWLLELRHGQVASDPTNGFKGFRRDLYISTKIRGEVGFTYGLQLLAFGLKNRLTMDVLPTIWHDRFEGASSFKMFRWLPAYFYWFLRVLLIKRVK